MTVDDVRATCWDGLHAVRDLGGLPARRPDGTPATTVLGRVFRSPTLSHLTPAGWDDLRAAGVRTVVDLRNDGEGETYDAQGLTVHRLPVEDQGDLEFMRAYGELLDVPDYYPEVLRRWPDLLAEVFRTVAWADGAVVVHCATGRDRTGQVSAMLLTLAGVPSDVVADEYEHTVRAVAAHARGTAPQASAPDDGALATELAARRRALGAFLDGLDVEAWLLAAGVEADDVARLRSRLLDA